MNPTTHNTAVLFDIFKRTDSSVRFLAVFLMALAISLLTSSPVSAQGFGIDVPYDQAVPGFLNAVTNAVQDVPNKEEIAKRAVWKYLSYDNHY